MAYDKALEQRIDGLIAAWIGIEKKKMFGGICYQAGGNICFGIWQEYLIIRCGQEAAPLQLQREHVRPFDVTGRPMRGWLMVAAQGYAAEPDVTGWLCMGYDFARTMPEK
ncbi:MAG TPA: RNA methyltransferase [Desulfuromonadales bacterium]|nr:RNA methyltransferase [Desulfuromonadales bacterium]